MVDWHDPAELQRESVAYVNVIFASFGLYIWEIFQTSDFELSVLQRRRKVRWHWVFFFICRYIIVFSIIALMASYTVKTPINCQALYTFICVTGNLAIICASTTLMYRTIALWQKKLPVMIILGVFCLAHWALLFRGMFVMTAHYDAGALACAATTSNRLFLSVTYWATFAFNLILLVFYVTGLMQRDHGATAWEMLFQDGVVCYLIAFSANVPPAILNVVNLSPIMDLICTVPAAVLTAMSACRTVTHLKEIDEDNDVYVHSSTQLAVPRPPPGTTAFRVSSRYPPRPEVHVTTDHIVMEDFDPSPCTGQDAKSPSLTDTVGEHGDAKSFNAV